MKHLAWVLSFVLGATAAFACSSPAAVAVDDEEEPTGDDAGFARDGSTYDSSPPPNSGLGQLRFSPTKSYSGFDGTRAFRVPVAVYDAASDLVVTSDDTSAATIAPTTLKNPVNSDGITDNGKYFLVTIKKAGTLNLTATSGGKTVTTTIEVAAYEATRWDDGAARYRSSGTGNRQACSNCHENGANIDHSPARLATSTDEEVKAIITTGLLNNFPIKGVQGGHKWDAEPAELDGLVTYLRAVEPRGFQ